MPPVKLHRTRSRRGTALSLLITAWLLPACSHRPRREMRQAEADLMAARKLQADIYAPSSFEEARRALTDAGRMVRTRKFEEARLLALESSALSKTAASLSAENREKMFAALQLQIQGVEQKVLQGEKEMHAAELKPIEPREREMFEKDLAATRANLDAARESLRQGNLVAGRSRVDDADVAAESLLREIRLTVAEEPVQRNSHRRPA